MFLQGKVAAVDLIRNEVCFAKRRGKNIAGSIWYKSLFL